MKSNEYYSVKFRDDAEKNPNIPVGTMIVIVYSNHKFYMVKVCWERADASDRLSEQEVEMSWYFDEENTKKLMLHSGTKNATDSMQAMFNRFKKHSHSADSYITRWCDEKGIKYDYFVHY